MDRGRALAPFGAHHQRGLAGERREFHLAVDVRGEVARKRGLAGARIAEQAEELRRAALARLVLQPAGDHVEGRVLMGREFWHEIPNGSCEGALVATRRILKQA